MKSPFWILLAVLVAFTAYTVGVVLDQGLAGVPALILAEPWAGQFFVDLVIALSLFLVWMVRDARDRGIPSLPYLVLTLSAGSIGALAYLVHRAAKDEPASA